MKDKSDKKRILLKVGTSTLTKGTKSISRGKLEDIGRQIVALQDDYEFILVCSGAIAVARQFTDLEGRGQSIQEKQALAAIGQPQLMRIIQEGFRELGLHTAQCLLSYLDFEREESKTNIVNTIEVLLKNGYIPVINENDTVATEEIQFGDNDKLAALTSVLLKTDLFVMATNTYGCYDASSAHPVTIDIIDDLDEILNQIDDSKSSQGSGGMRSKLEAAGIAQKAGIRTWLVNGWDESFLVKAMEGQTKFSEVTVS